MRGPSSPEQPQLAFRAQDQLEIGADMSPCTAFLLTFDETVKMYEDHAAAPVCAAVWAVAASGAVCVRLRSLICVCQDSALLAVMRRKKAKVPQKTLSLRKFLKE